MCSVTATLSPRNSMKLVCPLVDETAELKTQLLASLTLLATEINESW